MDDELVLVTPILLAFLRLARAGEDAERRPG
jgi:hypothetical protein